MVETASESTMTFCWLALLHPLSGIHAVSWLVKCARKLLTQMLFLAV